MAMGVLKVFGTKLSCFKMGYQLTKNECFHLSLAVAEILYVGLSDQYNSFLWRDFSYLQWLNGYSS